MVRAALQAVLDEVEEVYPGEQVQQMQAQLLQDPKAVEKWMAGILIGTPEQAVQSSDVVLIALQPFVLEEVLSTVGSWENKIVLTCMSGLKPDFTGQTIGISTESP